MKKRALSAVLIVLSVSVLIFVLIFVFGKDYRVSKDDSFSPFIGGMDLYHASREELIGADLCNYTEAFGEVDTAKEAAEIAAKVIEKVYGNDESPYIVKYNENANAWIVHGRVSPFHIGGVASIAIDKDTGEILMLSHTK